MVTSEDKYTQQKDIDKYLTKHPEGLTTIEAFEKLNITKLSTRISEMIKLGYKISKIPELRYDSKGRVIKRFMRYRKVA